MSFQSRLAEVPLPNSKHIQSFMRHKSLAGLSETTVTNYVETVLRFLQYYGYDTDLMLVTRDNIEEYLVELRRTKKPSSVQATVVSLRVFFEDLLGKEKCGVLLDGIRFKVPIVKVREEELLTNEDIRNMIACARNERDRALVSLLYSSGCRSGEIMSLKVKDVSFSRYGASIHVCGKTGERDVDIFAGAVELKAYYNVHPKKDNPDAPFWLTYDGCQLHKSGMVHVLETLAERAGVPKERKINPHAFRHRRATDCADFMSIADMKEMFGWTDESNMPAVYVHSSRRRVAEKLMEQAGIKVPEQRMPTSLVKQCPVCGCVNAGDATICVACSSALEEKVAVVDANLRDFLRDHMDEILAYKRECEEKSKKEDSET